MIFDRSIPMIRNLLSSALLVAILALPAFGQYDWEPYEDNPVMDFDFDRTSFFMQRPAVIEMDGVFHMWYGKQIGLVRGSPRSVGYATSINGIDWELRTLNAIEPSGVLGTFDEVYATNATVVPDGDTLRMWYNGVGNLASGLGYAWSIDGINWTKVEGNGAGGSVFDPAMDPASVLGVVTPTAVKLGDTFHLWYVKLVDDGNSRVGYLQSTNGRDWTVIPGPGIAQSVVDIGGFSDFDADQVWWPWVIYNEDAGIFEMWYQGIDAPQFGGVPRLGCARSSDGVDWEKVAGTGEKGACWNSFAQPGVVLDGTTYKMWYTLTTDISPNNDIVQYAVSEPMTTSIDGEVPRDEPVLATYPNPFTSTLTVELNGVTEPAYTVDLIDPLGRTVLRRVVPNSVGRIRTSIDVNSHGHFARGTYFVRVSGSSGLPLGTSVLQRQ